MKLTLESSTNNTNSTARGFTLIRMVRSIKETFKMGYNLDGGLSKMLRVFMKASGLREEKNRAHSKTKKETFTAAPSQKKDSRTAGFSSLRMVMSFRGILRTVSERWDK